MFEIVNKKISLDTLLITFFKTRPMWGMIPIRLIYGSLITYAAFQNILFLERGGAFELVCKLIELIAGVLIVFGFLTRLAGFFLMVEIFFFVVIEQVSFGQYLWDAQFGLLVFSIACLFIISGAGRFSADRAIARRMLRCRPDTKHEAYVIAETIYTKM
jgi:uncharacterized membrane protein YphA (DoxX/SURF4 family)